MTANQIRHKYIEFFKSKGHIHIPSAPLIPENDPTILFTTAGMHPLVPYLLGESHPEGKRLVNFQKCIRTDDLEEVGDETHNTFFEMLGNWSLGDYFKKQAIEWSLEFLTSKEWLSLDIKKLAISVFAGDKNAPRDEESARIWLSLGIPKARIAYLGKKDNWWGPAGQTGPCGPDTEMFYWTGNESAPEKFDPEDERWVEIWNDVFMQYNKLEDGSFELLKQQNVDTGMGLERVTAIIQGKSSIYQTELFQPIIEAVKCQMSNVKCQKIKRSCRIIADHLRSAVFILGDERGVAPSNEGQGYILRRLIRRAIRQAKLLGIEQAFTHTIAQVVVDNFGDVYPELKRNQNRILTELSQEEKKFAQTLDKGLSEFERMYYIDIYRELQKKNSEFRDSPASQIKSDTEKLLRNYFGADAKTKKEQYDSRKKIKQEIEQEKQQRAQLLISLTDESSVLKQAFQELLSQAAFKLFDTYGFPLEMTRELCQEKGVFIDEKIFEKELKKHKEKSRQGAEKRFKGGLADSKHQTTKLHTATHLLQQALREVLGHHIKQMGSNITPERLRFDFAHSEKLTPEQTAKTEDIVNQVIRSDLEIKCDELSIEEAKKQGAIGLFPERYGNRVKVYSVGSFSKEVCGGPHIKRTGELGEFKIIKEESSSAGVRRIKAILKNPKS